MGHGTPKEQLELLRSVSIFAGLSDRELEGIDRLVDEIEVPEGEILTRQGASDGQQAFVVVEGEASVEIDGREVATVGPGGVIGEMAMLDAKPRSATVTALTAMRLLIIGPAAFGTFIAKPAVAMSLLKAIVARLRAAKPAPAVEIDVPQKGAA